MPRQVFIKISIKKFPKQLNKVFKVRFYFKTSAIFKHLIFCNNSGNITNTNNCNKKNL